MIEWTKHIEYNPNKLYGRAVVLNTRIPVCLILEKLAYGDTFDDLLDAYSGISRDDIKACLMFAADSVKNEIVN